MFTSVTKTFSYIGNLLSILRHIPAVIPIIKAVMDIIGSDAVRQIIEEIRAAAQSEPNTMPSSDAGRKRLLQRIRDRAAMRLMGIREKKDCDVMIAYRDVHCPLNDAETPKTA